MSSKAKKLLNEALRLPPAEREALAGELFDSLETDDPDAEVAWQAEIARRIAELDQGKVKQFPWAEARRLIFGARNSGALQSLGKRPAMP
jgi:putative addiction module component (TIGR02574 family)